MKYSKYPSYRDSGIEWLGDIPEHWEYNVIRRDLIEHKQGFYTTEAYNDDGVKLLRITDIKSSGHINYDKCPRVVMDSEDKHFLLKNGDFVFARTGGAGSFGYITNLIEDVLFASYLIRFRFNSNFKKDFLKYYFLSMSFINSIESNIHGGVNKNIHAEDIKDSFIAKPSLSEQQTIANYLDKATSIIDTLIVKQTRLIALLKEKRQAVISTAVTRGLDSKVAMKNSGVEWLGDIPEHWEVMPVKRIFKRVQRNIQEGDGIITAFRDGIVTLRTNRRTTGFTNAIHEHGYQRILPNDLVVHAMDAFAGAIGVSDSAGKSTPVYSVLVAHAEEKVNPQYFGHILRVMSQRKYIEALSKGIRERSTEFRFNELAILKLPICSKKEQNNIIETIEIETVKADKLIIKSNELIELLKEKRTTLISSVVTGKIDVRNAS